MQKSLMDQGFDLMIFGMGTVFVFLTLLVFCTYFMSYIISRFLSEPEVEVSSNNQVSQRPAHVPVNAKTLSIIQAAIAAHKQQ